MIEKIALTVPGNPEGTPYILKPVAGMPSSGGINTINAIVQWATTTLLIVGSLLAILLIIFGGIKIITSGGDKAALESGRKFVVFAVIGLAIIFSSFFIMSVIQSIFGVRLLGGIPLIK